MSFRGLLRQGAGYVLTGGLAAVVDIGGFHLLSARMDGVLVPAVLSFLAAAVVNYLLSSVFVFGRDWRSARRAGLFIVFASIGLAINAGSTWLLASSLPIAPTWAKVGGVGIAFAANFLMNALIVFRPSGTAKA
ncbi:GtrA family protein [Ramlibacter rhizophilus]|uniref:GtrA family protein n=1 Tax=Ramlibacter rhizophilus TaxID=1781167 RepID=A0A4Z0C352_9BURK|nr:GtrA family protein [Ramlibacter rhizophilus]TFZ04918.1 GtrA family protein [Ramlibacter rhizophilus]